MTTREEPNPMTAETTREPLTCERCGLADATVKKQRVNTGCVSDRPTPFYEIRNLHPLDDERDVCIDALNARLAAAERERDALRKQIEQMTGHKAVEAFVRAYSQCEAAAHDVLDRTGEWSFTHRGAIATGITAARDAAGGAHG